MSVNPVNSLSQAASPRAVDGRQGLKEAAAEFESLFINQMLKSMRETITKGELFHGGNAEEIYTSMLDTELSKNMARSGGIGLSEMLLRQFSDGTEAPASSAAPDFQAQLPPFVLPAAQASAPAVSVEKRAPVASVQAAPVQPAAAHDAAAQEREYTFPVREMKRISSGFGERKDPFSGSHRFHHGMDIAAKAGTPVYPASKGTVIFSGVKGGYGNMVEVLHDDGLVTRYGHNAENIVKEGDIVTPSKAIAFVGSTGRSTGPHLHFEVLKDGKALDPGTLYAMA
ncbi:MAG: peptidoglycan DD-metalloendopeptidase family protein [Deltaproteobacteria bacterium]|nr:peptidoglycan DD-metalloendopeptidase family protein [Deltaproteobacteria bacterium]